MKQQNFVEELLSYGTGFAMGFLVLVGAAIVFAVFLTVIIITAFLNRLLN